jgi:hypothetical protein
MKKVIRLTESDLVRIVKRTINEMDKDMTETNIKTTMEMFGHCLGRTEEPCKYTVKDLYYEILDDDPDIDKKLKRIGLKLTKSSQDADGFVEYRIWNNDVYRQVYNLE